LHTPLSRAILYLRAVEKTGKTMAVARVQEFIGELVKASSESAVKALCDSELAYLRESLGITWEYQDGIPISMSGSASGLHSQLTLYRNAVKSLDIPDSLKWEYVKDRKRHINHVALKYLVKADVEKSIRGENLRVKKSAKQQTRRFVDADLFLNTAKDLLESDSYLAVALGLMAVTGRRATEILKTAQFEKISDESVEFTGQLKTRGASTAQTVPYTIPTLIDADTVTDALQRLRALKDFSELTEKAVHSKCNKSLGESVRRKFAGVFETPKPKDLRAIYAACCLEAYYNPHTMGIGDDEYLARILGHGHGDQTTAQSYKEFSLL